MSDEQNQSPKELREYAERMKAEADTAKQELAEASAARRELAFIKAGVDVDSPAGKLLLKAYDGDLDVEKIKAEWEPLAPAKVETVDDEDPDDGPTEAEKAGAAASRSLRSDGAPPGEEPSEDPRSLTPYLKDVEKGVSPREAQRRQVQRLVSAAHTGDERALFDPARWRAEQGE